MLTRLPRWVWIGAWVLTFVAGTVNVVGLLGFERQPVSHLTATTSRLAAAIARGDAASVGVMAGLIGSFVLGAIISGWLIESPALELGRHYATALLLECFLLSAAIILLQREQMGGTFLCCAACGLQNAMASTYSSAIIRTTHMTGLFTDLGVLIGQRLRGRPTDWKRLQLCGTLISGFSFGGLFGAIAFNYLHYLTLLFPIAITGGTAIAYRVYERRHAI